MAKAMGLKADPAKQSSRRTLSSDEAFQQDPYKPLPSLPIDYQRQAFKRFNPLNTYDPQDAQQAFQTYSTPSRLGSTAHDLLLDPLPAPNPQVYNRANSYGGKKGFRWCSAAWHNLILDTWFTEIASWIFSAICLVCTIIILDHFNGRPLPQWPYNITLNTLIALFVTLTTTALMGPVSQSLSQLKWIWFTHHGKRAFDLELYDQASRGVTGSFRLMFHSMGSNISSLGALITILVLAANTVTQQSIRYVPILTPDVTNGSATSPRATWFGSYDQLSYSQFLLRADPDLQTLAAFDSGLLAGNRTYPHLRLGCSTGNCTWPEYKTLGVCAFLANVTSRLTIHCTEYGSIGSCFAKLPGVQYLPLKGGLLTAAFVVGPTLNGLETKKVPSVAFQDVLDSSAANFFVLWNADFTGTGSFSDTTTPRAIHGAQAVEINLRYCVQSLESGVKRGASWTKVIATHTDFKLDEDNNGHNLILNPAQNWTAILPVTKERFGVGTIATNSISNYTSLQFNGSWAPGPDGVTANYPTIGVRAAVNALTNPPYNLAGLEILANNLATALTNNIRSQGYAESPAVGQSLFLETYVHVDWSWITLLIVIDFLGLFFLLYVILQNKIKGCEVWKTSNLALIQALEPESRYLDGTGLRSNSALQLRAKDVLLKLRTDGQAWRLVDVGRS